MKNPRLSVKYAMTLFFLIDFMKEKHYAPLVSEIAEHFGLAGNSIRYRLMELEKKIISRFCGMRRVACAGSM